MREALDAAQKEARELRSEYEKLRCKNDALHDAVGQRAEALAGAQEEARELRSENEALRRENDALNDAVGENVKTLVEGIYAQSRRFAERSVRENERRGLLIVLVDRDKMNERNFSAHNSEPEILESKDWRDREKRRILSRGFFEIMDCTAKEKNERGETGEKRGAILVDLRGVMFRTRQMIEGVQTRRADSNIPRRRGGRYDAAKYASSLPEAAAAFVVEDNLAALFIDGKINRRKTYGFEDFDAQGNV